MNCRVCAKETKPFLQIPTAALDEPFLDPTLRRELPELKLRQCRQCSCLWADDARHDDEVLASAYERLSASYFDSQPGDPRYTRFYERIEQSLKRYVSGRTIVDVGCGDGVFLGTLSSDWTKRGVEPSESGARLARQRNLDVDCATLETTNRRHEADVISALDVIEHVIDPHRFIDSVKRHLGGKGFVLLLTGDIGSYPASVAGPWWSYLRWCGHISIFSRSGLQRLLESHGFQVVHWRRCEHPSSPGAIAWWRVHLLEPARRALGRNRSWYPFWRDHQLVIAQLK